MIYLKGRIDSTNAAETEEYIRSQIEKQGNTELSLDFSEVTYISSAGLRVLLSLRKEYTDFLICNVHPDVYEVFEFSGFSRIITVLRKPSIADTTGMTVLGSGVTGTVYKANDEVILKQYNPSITIEMIGRELNNSKIAFVKGIPTAIPFDIVKTKDGFAARYELMNGNTLGKAFQREPEHFEEYIKKYVELVSDVGRVKMDEGSFESIKTRILKYLNNFKDHLSAEDYGLLAEVIDCLPESNGFVHGDLHTGNIMVQNGELMLIDMADVAVGWPLYDFTQVYNDLQFSLHRPGFTDTVEKSINMPAELGDRVWQAFFAEYGGNELGEAKDRMRKAMDLLTLPIAMCRIGALPPEFAGALVPDWKKVIIDDIVIPNKDLIKRLYSEINTREDLIAWVKENNF